MEDPEEGVDEAMVLQMGDEVVNEEENEGAADRTSKREENGQGGDVASVNDKEEENEGPADGPKETNTVEEIGQGADAWREGAAAVVMVQDAALGQEEEEAPKKAMAGAHEDWLLNLAFKFLGKAICEKIPSGVS